MKNWINPFWIGSVVLGFWTNVTTVSAQVVPDNTLPVDSQVTGCPVCLIEGGTVRGVNLFHSFEEFSVQTGGEAFFNNALQIENIFGRVTGSKISDIDGLIRANGTANLFLINPNGIVFGENARLNVGGSFVASTANSVAFSDGSEFSAKPDIETSPLLTLSVPIGLQFGTNPGKIVIQGNSQGTRLTSELFASDSPDLIDLPDVIDTDFGLRVPSNQTLAIVGSDISLLGGTLKTAGGRIELGSVADSGFVSLTPITKGWALGYQGVSAFGDIQLSQQAAVDASGLGAGDIAIWGRHLSLTGGSQIEASTLGSQLGGTLAVNATDAVEVIGVSVDGQFHSLLGAVVYPGAKGTGGELSIDTKRLIVRDGGSAVITGTFGEGQSGTLRVNATESVELVGRLSNGESSGLFAVVYPGAKGAGSELRVDTGQLIIRDGAVLGTATFGEGASGNLRVNATESVELVGRSSNGRQASGLFTSVQRGARGTGGELSIDTKRLIVLDGAVLSAGTLGEGQSGNLRVNATESVEVTGTGRDGFPSILTARTGTAANGGTLTINTERLVVGDKAQITVSSTSSGQAGILELQAESILLNNQASLQANTTGGGGKIVLTTPLLLLRRGSNITTNAQGINIQGGNITIDTDQLVAIPQENSDISANSQDSRGGNITINAQGIFGIQFSLNFSS
jgi:filamentous hemagglutinin family protein